MKPLIWIPLIACVVSTGGISPVNARDLRVCADPNNLPFSNDRGEGFENKIVSLIAGSLDMKIDYVWRPQRRGFIRDTINAGLCDLLPGIPVTLQGIRATRPYYRSMYTFISGPKYSDISSFDDPRLKGLKIGVQLIGDGGYNAPPAQALTKRGLTGAIKGFPVYGDYREPNPPAAIIDAVEKGNIDVAVAWGPMAGYFAAREPIPLSVNAVSPLFDGPANPMVFDIAMGVRIDDEVLYKTIDTELEKNRKAIDAILDSYNIPRAK